ERAAVYGRVESYRTTRSAAFVRGNAHDCDPEDTQAHVSVVFMTIASDPRQKRETAKSEGDTDD
ncbi:MAG: phenylacetic acid degradation protein, partial [Pseudomonadota bacterium]